MEAGTNGDKMHQIYRIPITNFITINTFLCGAQDHSRSKFSSAEESQHLPAGGIQGDGQQQGLHKETGLPGGAGHHAGHILQQVRVLYWSNKSLFLSRSSFLTDHAPANGQSPLAV